MTHMEWQAWREVREEWEEWMVPTFSLNSLAVVVDSLEEQAVDVGSFG